MLPRPIRCCAQLHVNIRRLSRCLPVGRGTESGSVCLDELLLVRVSEANKPAKTVGLDELAQRKISDSEKITLSELNRGLLVYVAEANPVLRPIAREYQAIIALLARGKRNRIGKRLS